MRRGGWFGDGFGGRLGGWFEAARARLVALTGWRRFLATVGLGVLAALALPPVHAVPLLVPAFVGLAWLIGAPAPPRNAFASGFAFGCGFFAAGLYWIAHALLVDAARFAWMIPFAVGGLAAGLAIFPAAAALLARLLCDRLAAASTIALPLWLAVAWTLAEWVRGYALTGFPWNLAATVWTFSDAMMQPAAWFGVFGLSLITVAAAALPAALAAGAGGTFVSRRAVAATLLAFAALAFIYAAGTTRLYLLDEEAGAVVPGVRLRLVQPNIAQNLKWKTEARRGHVLKQIEMSLRPPAPGEAPPTHVLWAETAVPFFLANDPGLRASLVLAAPPGGALIAGAPRTTPTPETPYRVWNSLHVLDRSGAVVGTYDKFHLVPFGEYVPFRRFVPFAKLTHGEVDFSPGPGRVALDAPGVPSFAPLICYEAIFPGRVVPPDRRPGWLLNLTNDAWFGISSGPYQHFAATRFRAVEEGMPLVRVANNGISAIVDSLGRVRARLPLGAEGIVDGALPARLERPTAFARLGHAATVAALLVGGALAFWLGRAGRGAG